MIAIFGDAVAGEGLPVWTVVLAALAGVPGGAAAMVLARWLPAWLERDWLEQCRDGIAAEPLPKVRFCRRWQGVVLVVAALLCTLCVARFGVGIQAALAVVLCLSLLVLALIDLQTTLLPDIVTLPLLWAGLLANSQGTFVLPSTALFGAVAGYLCLFGIGALFKLVTRREGMGGGDVKLLAALGAWLGWTALPAIACAAAVSGLVVALLQRARGGGPMVPFGPHLAAAGVLMLLAGQPDMRLLTAWMVF